MSSTRLGLAGALALALAACSDPARVTVLLKDAPADFTHAVVTITQVSLQGEGGTTVLSTKTTTTDLLTLANDVETLVDGVEIPAGTYSQLRFRISGGYVEVGGVIYASSPDYEGLPAGAVVGGTLQMPSFDQSGLKVLLPGGAFEIAAGTTKLLVDFDVSQSFGHVAGNSGGWVMHPVVKATPLEQTSSLEVVVFPGEGVTLPDPMQWTDFSAVLTPAAGGDPVPVRLAPAAQGYSARFQFVLPGDYLVTLTGPAGLSFGTDPAIPAPVTIAAGDAKTMQFQVTFASTGAEL